MKLGSSHGDAHSSGEGSRGPASGGSLSISAVMQDLKEKFKNDEDDHCTRLFVLLYMCSCTCASV